MDRRQLKAFNFAQMKEILKYKWIESEKNKFDIGENRAAFEWISKYSADYRLYWCKCNLDA